MSKNPYLFPFDREETPPPHPTVCVDGVNWVGPIVGKYDGGTVEYRANFDKFVVKFTHLNGISKGSISMGSYPLVEWDMVEVSPDNDIEFITRALRSRVSVYLYQMSCRVRVDGK